MFQQKEVIENSFDVEKGELIYLHPNKLGVELVMRKLDTEQGPEMYSIGHNDPDEKLAAYALYSAHNIGMLDMVGVQFWSKSSPSAKTFVPLQAAAESTSETLINGGEASYQSSKTQIFFRNSASHVVAVYPFKILNDDLKTLVNQIERTVM